MKKKAILFDLDGTLLPMDQDAFVKVYFEELSRAVCPLGYEKRQLVDGIWKGTGAMIQNDGRASNEDVFWKAFAALLGDGVLDLKDRFESFYQNEFHRARQETRQNPRAREAVRLARARADLVILATNPLFPACGVKTRLSWVGLDLADFDLVTTYENSTYCKPNPMYFAEILQKVGVSPHDCLMIGNDVAEDMAACKELGIETYLVTDCLLDHGLAVDQLKRGTFSELVAYLGGPG